MLPKRDVSLAETKAAEERRRREEAVREEDPMQD
jgi:hypothetical protein